MLTMYLRRLKLNNLRCFAKAELAFQYPGRVPGPKDPPLPRLPNVNLLLGINGTGKSTVLKGAALALISPVLADSGFRPYSLVRRTWKGNSVAGALKTRVEAQVQLSEHEARGAQREQSLTVELMRRGTNDSLSRAPYGGDLFEEMYVDTSPSFLVLAYAANRWTARAQENISARLKETHLRYQRVRGLFEESSSLVPLTYWLPNYSNPGRKKQVIHKLDQLLGDFYRFRGLFQHGEYLVEKGDTKVPMGALSDGYRAYLGWVGDMLYHVCFWARSGRKLEDTEGIVMVDEIDLHLHPEWQRTVIQTLSETFPKIQFLFTSHSPLVTGSLEWPNIHVMRENGPEQIQEAIHGLSADQVLYSPYFELQSTRPPDVTEEVSRLESLAQGGDDRAALELMRRLAFGSEALRNGSTGAAGPPKRTAVRRKRTGTRKRAVPAGS